MSECLTNSSARTTFSRRPSIQLLVTTSSHHSDVATIQPLRQTRQHISLNHIAGNAGLIVRVSWKVDPCWLSHAVLHTSLVFIDRLLSPPTAHLRVLLPHHQSTMPSLHRPHNLSLSVAILLIFIGLLHTPSVVVATCEQCALTGNCSAALPNNQTGTFCSTTTTNNQTTYLCCLSTFTCIPSTSPSTNSTCQPLHLAIALSSAASTGSDSSSSNDGDGFTNSSVSYAFIAVSLLFAGVLALLVFCVCCNALVACGTRWRYQRRRQAGRKAVVPVEDDKERQEREEREELERQELEREEEQREIARLKEERVRRERQEMNAIVARAREQVERRRRARQQAALELAAVETSEDQRTEEGRESGTAVSAGVESAVVSVDEIELGQV